MQEYVAMWKNYFNFSDRTSVRGFWMATLISIIIAAILGVLTNISSIFQYVTSIYSIAYFIPSLAIMIRRLRDASKSWGWMFIGLVPVIGWIILIVFLCQPTKSTQGVQV